jgi:hypothetical protein
MAGTKARTRNFTLSYHACHTLWLSALLTLTTRPFLPPCLSHTRTQHQSPPPQPYLSCNLKKKRLIALRKRVTAHVPCRCLFRPSLARFRSDPLSRAGYKKSFGFFCPLLEPYAMTSLRRSHSETLLESMIAEDLEGKATQNKRGWGACCRCPTFSCFSESKHIKFSGPNILSYNLGNVHTKLRFWCYTCI